MTPCQKLLKQEGTARRIESMQQSSATPSLHLWFLGVAEDCCMLSILLYMYSPDFCPFGEEILYACIHVYTLYVYMYNTRCIHENINEPQLPSLQGLDLEQSPNAQDAFRPMLGLFSCAGVTGSVGVLRHARITQMAGLIRPKHVD